MISEKGPRLIIELGLQVLLRRDADLDLGNRDDGPTITILFGSDHGLCGHFNDQIVRFAVAALARSDAATADILWLPVGAQAVSRLEALGKPVDDEMRLPGSVNGLTTTTQQTLLTIDSWRTKRRSTKACSPISPP